MFSSWLAAHKSLVATVTSGSVVAALVATVAIVSTGYTAQRLDLNDASVWVANSSRQVIGRANTEILELNSVVASTSSDISVIQQGATVLLIDRANSKIDIADPATSLVTDSVALPPNSPQVFLVGNQVVILERGTGEAWIVALVDLASFDFESPSSLSWGADAVASVDDAGVLYAFSPTAGQVFRLDLGATSPAGAAESAESVGFATPQGTYSITSVDNRWAVLDSNSRQLYLSGQDPIDLSGSIAADDSPALQVAASTGAVVFVGYANGLLSIPVGGGQVTTVTDAMSGLAAAPAVVGECAFGAWSGGSLWRKCGSADAEVKSLDGMASTARLTFARNGDRVLLNDERGGAAWAVQRDGELIDNWAELITQDENQQVQQENEQDKPPEVDKVQVAPVAIDDNFGARPGRSTLIPVLLNDYDANGDVLVISEVTAIDESVGRIDLINERQQLQLTLTDTATGVIGFRYAITDGRGGTASASVTVTVRSPGENSAPVQVRASRTTVVAGGRVTTKVLGDWVDPDGDTMFVTNASASAPDVASFKPDGVIVFADSGADQSAIKSVSIAVSDGTSTGSGSLSITVRPSGEVPIIADPFVVLAYSGEEVTVRPLDHVRGGTGTIRLTSVPAKTGVTIIPSYESGTFRVVSDEVRTHYLEFTVSDGDQTITGLVRVDVASPPDVNTKPITVPKTVFVQFERSQRVDVAGTDIDPAGGVLLVTGVMNVPVNSGVRAEVLEQRLVRVSLDAPLDNGPVTFNYRISNGFAEAEGVITVVEIPAPSRIQPPIATDDEVTVRVGAAIDIPVLANDEQPDGEQIRLVPTLAQPLPDDAGLLFASGTNLRYLAPDRTGNFTAVYEIESGGQTARAQLRIRVREVDVATNSAPIPNTVTARVLAGESVRIEIPLSGIDPDGDTVQLLGQETSPDKGSVDEVGPNFVVYRAGDYSQGTDTFTYTVIDSLGARATGVVRIGISARLDGARNPVAIVDEVTVRPGTTVSVQVLANDSDPDGSPLSVVAVEPSDATVVAIIEDNIVKITPPPIEGQYGLVYTISNETGGTSSAFIRVIVDAEAPLSFPVASDSVLTLTDVLDRETVDVNVLANVFFADGDPSALGISVFRGFGDSAEVLPNKRIRVTIGDNSQIIPFTVTHPDDPAVFSSAFIWVPGYNDALPQINRTAPELIVNSEDTLRIDLNDYVIAVGGRQVRLTDTATVRATHANGDNLVVDQDTLSFTSADKYFGPASIAFEVTDATSDNDPEARTANIVLPIRVDPRTNQPPVFGGAKLEFEPGQEKVLDLLRLTNYPYDDQEELVYTVIDEEPIGFTYTLIGQRLTIRANEDAPKGTTTAMTLTVRDDLAEGQAGRISLAVVPSTRPLTRPAADNAVTKRGETTVIDVLANDEATNPFPGSPLSVVAIRGLEGSTLPEGVTVQPSADRSRLTVSVSATALPTDTNLQYQVADSTGDPDRFVWGSIRISVQDRPDPVTNVRVTEFGDRRLLVAWASGAFNNSAITGYVATLTRADTGETISTTNCDGAQCWITTPGNGSANAVRISVTAVNEIGASDPALNPAPIWSDVIPAPPTGLTSTPVDQGLNITWRKPSDGGTGTPITRYVVSIDGGPVRTVTVPTADAVGASYTLTIADPRMANGSAVTYTVSARNDSFNSLATWNQSSAVGYPAGPPLRTGSPSASASIEDGTTASLSWADAFAINGRPISNYYAVAYTGAAPTCSPSGDLPASTVNLVANGGRVRNVGTATSTTFTGLVANTTYSFVVFAFNGMGCTDSPVVQATPRARPGTVSNVTMTQPEPSGDYTWDSRLTSFQIASGSTDADSFIYRLSGPTVEGSEYGPVAPGAFLTTSNGSHYGRTASVQVKACRVYPEGTLCSASWSAPFGMPMAVSNSALVDLFFTRVIVADDTEPDTGSFSWSSTPIGDYPSLTFSCDGGVTITPVSSGTPGACDVTEIIGSPEVFPPLTFTITVNGTEYPRTYNWEDYD